VFFTFVLSGEDGRPSRRRAAATVRLATFTTFGVLQKTRRVLEKKTRGGRRSSADETNGSRGSLNLAETTAYDAAGHRMPDDDRRPPMLSPSPPNGRLTGQVPTASRHW
jgi:hypothetical protein